MWSRVVNVFRGDRVLDEIDEEMAAHVEEAIEQGRDPEDARRAFGSPLRRREESRDIRMLPWLDALRADAVFGWRQLTRHGVTSAMAVLSLGLGIGACTTAFRLIDALLLRPLPVAEPGQLYVLSRHDTDPGNDETRESDGFEYPLFQALRAAAVGRAELIAASYVARADLTHEVDGELEQAYRQYVSGWMFDTLGLRAALGRLLTASDDLQPRAHPYAVISYDYWAQRFGRDPDVIGRTFRMDPGPILYEIVGVVESRFTGTEPGTMTDIFVATMMHPGIDRADWTWFRIFARIERGARAHAVQDSLQATFRTFREDVAPQFRGRPRQSTDRFLNETLVLEPAAAGVSAMQGDYRQSLVALAALVAVVLLIACVNVANLLTAQATARSREMALRVSIGAGRWRLVQLTLVESAWLACLAASVGVLFAWWSAPFVVSMVNPPDNPARLVLPPDWRVVAFTLTLTVAVTGVFGLTPAWRASAVTPLTALRGGAPSSKRLTMQGLVAAQVAFCVFVLFVSGLFVSTFDRLTTQPTGFSEDRLLAVEVGAPWAPPASWDQLADHLAAVPGVEGVALTSWPLLSGTVWNTFIAIDGALQERRPYFLTVSPRWAEVMKIPLIDGRDFRADETYPGVAIVNEAFAKQYFDGVSPIGRWFEETPSRGNALPQEAAGTRFRVQIVGLVADARYRNLREPVQPTVYVPFRSVDANGAVEPIAGGVLLVRTIAADPLALVSSVRHEISRARPDFRISSIRTQNALNASHTVRERLLATLAVFFAGVALLLAGIGVCGVLYYSVIQRQREIGIRMALGSTPGDLARRVTVQIFSMVLIGSVAGLALGLASERYVATLLYGVTATDPLMLAVPWVTMIAVVILAALPPVIRAVRIDPLTILRAE